MAKNTVVRFPGHYEAEIEIAERAEDLILERMARGRLPDDVPEASDVAVVLDAVGELLFLDARESDGRKVSPKQMEAVVARLESGVAQLATWPDLERLLALAPLVEALDELEVEWIGMALMGLMPDVGALAESGGEDAARALRRVLVVHVRTLVESRTWDPEFEPLLQALHERWLDEPEVGELEYTLHQAVVFHAIRGRQSLLEEKRRAMAAAEPLPGELVAALDDFSEEVGSLELIRWSVHLVIADALAAGLVPPWANPRAVVAAAELAIIREDDPELDPVLPTFAKWTRTKPQRLRTLRDSLAQALEWLPPGYDGTLDDRQDERWRVESGPRDLLPARWTPDREAEDVPPYSIEAARARIDELRDRAWMIIDGWEAVKFVVDAFRFGGDAPDEIDEEIAREILEVWRDGCLIDLDRLSDDEDDEDELDEWDDDLEADGGGGFPKLVTTDGDPLVLCAAEYGFPARDRAEVVRRLDAMPELQREQEDGSERWVWLEDRGGQDLVIGSIEVARRRLTAESMSVVRSATIGAGLARHLGELVTLVDLKTEPATPEMMARRARQAPRGGQGPALSPEEERELVQRTLEQHYRSWPDEELPALGGLTPREAVEDREGRERVIALLRDFEESQASAPEPMRGFDFGFLWQELGLDRDDR